MPAVKVVPVRECRKHLEEAYLNYQRYLQFVQEPENFDWAVVLLFYSALHLVQAHAVSKSKIAAGVQLPEKHVERANYIANHLGEIAHAYSILQNASEDARYSLIRRPPDEIKHIHDRYYIKVKNCLEELGFAWKSKGPVQSPTTEG